MRMVQANNQTLGSPANRIGILSRTLGLTCHGWTRLTIRADWAALGYEDSIKAQDRSISHVGIQPWLLDRYRVWAFKATLLRARTG
jgi:hypothetical protein